MSTNMILSFLYIAPSAKRGKGIFTAEQIPKDTVVEVSPVIVLSNNDRLLLDQTLLHDYIFEWGQKHNQCCVALGYISLYNHSYQSNCEYTMDYKQELISICSICDIKPGEELFINYNGDWNDVKKIWFDVK
jgi:uncharacterized protein